MIALALLVFVLLLFFALSAAVIFHLWKYSPERDRAIILIGVYSAVSLILIILTLVSFSAINWNDLL